MKTLMMLVVSGLLLVSASGGQPAPARSAPVNSKALVGLWKLARIEARRADGTVGADPDLGPHAQGYIYYDAAGHMGVQLMNPERPRWKSEDKPTAEEALVSSQGFEAYSGTYEVQDGYVVHHLELSYNPNVVGQAWKRKYEVRGPELRLTPPAITLYSGEKIEETLVWQRVR